MPELAGKGSVNFDGSPTIYGRGGLAQAGPSIESRTSPASSYHYCRGKHLGGLRQTPFAVRAAERDAADGLS